MNKKIWNKVLAIIVAIVLVIGISAGTAILVDKKSVPAMTTVENGLSAYELAVQYGYEGTVQEWLESLNGKSAYEIAKENGYTGTETEWTTSLKATAGKDGVGIKTAAFSDSNELLITLTDGTVLNLGVADGLNGKDGANGKDGVDGKNGLNGKDGVDGKDGADGKDGEIGPAGKDGVSITAANINEEGQLVLTFSDGKIFNLDKLVGINGKDGIGIASSEINANGELVITYTNGQTANLGVVVGAKGDKGDKGDKGETGAAGKDGISVTKTEINNKGELVITLSDNTVSNLGVVVGAKGDKGDTGAQGIQGEKGDKGDQGEQGISVTGAEINSNGELVLIFYNNQRTNVGKVIGAKGDKGDKGDQGEQGIQGEKGETGATGATGAQGEQGIQGEKGDKGDKGDTGAAGNDGVSVTKTEINQRGELVITLSDNTVSNLGVVVGAKGEKGEKGDKGDKGETGETGATGAQGQQGIQGEKGDKGDKGDTGAQGEQGIQGIQGETGAKGDDGVGIETIVIENGNLKITLTNETTLDLGNIKGEKGETGAQGIQGEKGDTGATGEAGVGISSATINEYGELVIIYTDGTNTNLGTVVGAKGEKGDQGAQGIQGEKGVGVESVAINADGELVIVYTNGDNINLGKVIGPKGVQGIQGEKGDQGAQGIQGEKGDKGDQGAQGIQGEKGDKGDQGAQGIQGEKGDKGDQGSQGIQGEKGDKGDQGLQGEQGVGVSEVAIENDELVITLSNGNVINLGNIKGTKGEKGDKGDTGEQGVSITNVTLTADGELSMTFSSGQTIPLGNIKGADGQDGVGIDEIYIQDGNLYVKKTTDTVAVNLGSIKGDQGIQGEKGEKGDKGDAGRGIVRTEVIDGELWITYSDDVDNPVNVGRVVDMNSVTDGDLVYTMLEDGTYSVKAAKTFTTTNLVIPSTYNGITVSKIADNGFENKACITTVSLPNTLTEIGKYAFSGCTGLTTVDIPASVKCIGAFSFYRSGLTTANLSATKWISGNDDFSYMTYSYRYNSNDNLSSSSETLKYYDMTSAENVANALRGSVCVDYISTYRGGKWTYTQRDFYWYAEEWTPLYVTDGVFEYLLLSDMTYAIKGSISAVESTELVIPSQYNGKAVTEILPNGFENFANLETVTIPSSINVIGKYAFKGCASATFVFEEETTYVCDFGYISVYNEDRMSSHYEYVSINASTSNNFKSRYLTYNKYIIRYENYERETINEPLYNATLTKSDS